MPVMKRQSSVSPYEMVFGKSNRSSTSIASDWERVYESFIFNVRQRLHLVLCMSPASEGTRVTCQRFPKFVTHCYVDWFHPWDHEALVSVGREYLTESVLADIAADEKTSESRDVALGVAENLASIDELSSQSCEIYHRSTGRLVHNSPKTFISFVQMFNKYYEVSCGFEHWSFDPREFLGYIILFCC